MPTRSFEAALRNGHFPSFSPVPTTLPPSRKVDESLLAAMVRVRRRLRFGRKPPKERTSVRQKDVSQDFGDRKFSEGRVPEDEQRLSTAPIAFDKDAEGVNCYDRPLQAGLCSSLSELGGRSNNCSSVCSQTRRARKKLDMSDPGSIVRLESPLPQRET